jgi:glycosidase
MSANDFADELDRLLHLYKPEITRSQLNLLDSHDTPRFLSCAGGDQASLKLAWLFMLTFPGAPCIYYGDEIGVDGEHDPDCRKSFPWDETKWNRDLLDYVRSAISLRKSNASLRRGTFARLWSADSVYAFGRALEGVETLNATSLLIVALNASDEPRQIEVQYEAKKKPKALFGQPSEVESKNGKLRITIPARSGVVLG